MKELKTILIIYPHWPPSNLAGVHRPRLIANNLLELGWKPLLLTVDEEYYEEPADPYMNILVSGDIEIFRVKAFRITSPRIIGDIGLRSFPFLYKKAINLIRNRKVDFVWIPIPSFYISLLGRLIHLHTKTPYGIDYIDPWIRNLEGRKNFRSLTSNFFARILEPIALKKASLISGVSEEYFLPAINRSRLYKIDYVAMPYGFDSKDHEVEQDDINIPWDMDKTRAIVYAGALLPNSILFLKTLFKAVKSMIDSGNWPMDIKFYFIGVGEEGKILISEYCAETGVNGIVQVTDRLPYLTVLNLLKKSYCNLILGSTEKHYTASKVFQNILSGKPIVSIFHCESSAISVLKESRADMYTIKYQPGISTENLCELWEKTFTKVFLNYADWNPNLKSLEKFSSKQSAAKLVVKIEEILSLTRL